MKHPDHELLLIEPHTISVNARPSMFAGRGKTRCWSVPFKWSHRFQDYSALLSRISRRCRLLGWIWVPLGLFLSFAALSPTVLAAGAGDGFESLFDGRSIEGWRGKSQFWSVRDGAITGETTEDNPTDGNTFLIFRDRVSDFELLLKVRILRGNSGIQYRSVDVGNYVVHGYQADIDAKENLWGDLYEEGGRGVIAKSGEKVEIGEDGHKVIAGTITDSGSLAQAVQWQDWNDYRVIAVGDRLVHEINGLRTVDVTDKQIGKQRGEGVLALQLHAGKPMHVRFKDIYLKKLR